MRDLNAADLDQIRRYLAENLPTQALARLDRREILRILRRGIQDRRVLERLGGVCPRELVLENIAQRAVGLGALTQLVDDESVTSLLVYGGGRVQAEVGGAWTTVDLPDWSDDDLRRVAQALALRGGGHLDPGQPYFDGKIVAGDGAPIRVSVSSLGDDGEQSFILALRRVRRAGDTFTLGELTEGGSMSRDMAIFLRQMAQAPVGTLIIGSVGTGKSTLLQALELEMTAKPIAIVDEGTEYAPVNPNSFIQRTPPPPPLTHLSRPHVDLSVVLRLTLRQHARILIVTEVRGAETAILLREASARWATYCTFHGDSPQTGVSRMLTLARSDSWSLRSPYGSASDADVYRDVARAFPFIVQTDVARQGKKARYVVRGIYRVLMSPGKQEPSFERLFWLEAGKWRRAKQIPALPQRVPPQQVSPATILARDGMEQYRKRDWPAARQSLERAVRQTRIPDPRWLKTLRELADGDATRLRQDAQQVIATLLQVEGEQSVVIQTLDDVRRSRPLVYAFVEVAWARRNKELR